MNADAFIAILVFFAVVAIYLGPWQALCTAYARQVIFEKRDRLFDMAMDGDLRFDSQEYREIRVSLEKLIRFAHDLTLLNFLVMQGFMTAPPKRTASDLRRNVQVIGNPSTRAKVEKLVTEAHRAVLMMMLAKSIFVIPVLLAWAYFKSTQAVTKKKIKQMAKPYGELVQIEAEAATVNRRMHALAA